MDGNQRGKGCLLALVLPATFPVMLGVLLLPARLLIVAVGEPPPSGMAGTGLMLALAGLGVGALAGTVALHVKMWRTFMRRDEAAPARRQ